MNIMFKEWEDVQRGKRLGLKEGLEKGLVEGRMEGRVEGENAKSLEIAKKLLPKMNDCDIAQLTELPLQQIKLLRDAQNTE